MPPLSLGVAGIGAKEFEAEQGGLFTACTGPDFHDDVARISWVAGQEPSSNSPLKPLHGGGRFREFGLGEVLHVSVAIVEERLGLGGGLPRFFVLGEHLDNVLEFGAFDGELARLFVVGRDLRAPHLLGQFVEPIAKAF